MFINSTTLIVIDSGVTDSQSLINAAASDAEILPLNSQEDGIIQITNALRKKRNLRSLQILSHGCPGELQLGNTRLNLNTLKDYAPILQTWESSI
jgi:hypothetical protein